MYILPAILMTQPQIAKFILRYRTAKFNEAKIHAEKMGKEGIRFPWESAYSGQSFSEAQHFRLPFEDG